MLPITGLPGGESRPFVAVHDLACICRRENLPIYVEFCEINLALAQ